MEYNKEIISQHYELFLNSNLQSSNIGSLKESIDRVNLTGVNVTAFCTQHDSYRQAWVIFSVTAFCTQRDSYRQIVFHFVYSLLLKMHPRDQFPTRCVPIQFVESRLPSCVIKN